MISRIISDSVTTVAKRLTGSISNGAGNGILISAVVGGSGHAEADFSAHVINATVRQAKGEDIPIISGLRVMDALKVSDFKGGFSADLEGDDGTRYVAYLPIGRVKLEGDDVLEVELSAPGDATATYAYTVSLCDLVSGPDNPLCYELIQGTGADQLVKDCFALYLVSNPTGATIQVKDEAGKTYNLIDTDVVDLANCLGEMESYEEIGTLFSDVYDLSQDIHAKIPANAYAVAVRGFFDTDRLVARSASEGGDVTHLMGRIRASKPVKARYLSMMGKGE